MPRRTAPRTLVLCLALLATACAPLDIWYKPGVPVAQADNQLLTCRTNAARDVPVNTQTRVTPVTIVPRRICDKDGNCTVFYERRGGDVIVFDANEGLRKQVVGQCMQARGYSPARIPPCPAEIKAAAPEGRTTTLPRLTDKSCVIRNRDGTWQIVTQGG